MPVHQEHAFAQVTEQTYPFLSEVADIRRRARRHIQVGAGTSGSDADRETVLRLLNEALATELICVLRYKRHYELAGDGVAEAIKSELLQHAQEEQNHADRIAQRIVELGGEPLCTCKDLHQPSRSEYVEDEDEDEDEDLTDILAEDLIAERIAIENYREIIQYLSDRDVTTRRLFEDILEVEQQHAEDMRGVRERMLWREAPVSEARVDEAQGLLPAPQPLAAT